MPTKTPGGSGASEKFLKQQAETHGSGAPNAPGHTELKPPGDAPAASDSGLSDVGIEKGTKQPGETGNLGPKMDPVPEGAKEVRGV